MEYRCEKEILGVDNSVKMLIGSLGKTWQWLGPEGWQRNSRVEWIGHNHQILLDLVSPNMISHIEKGNMQKLCLTVAW